MISDALLTKRIDELIERRLKDRLARKTVDKAVYYGGQYDRNGQLIGGLTGGPEYGFAQRTVTAFYEKIGFAIPMQVSRRFRQGTGFALHADSAPGTGARASFDIQLAPIGTPFESTDWSSIFTAEDPSGLYHIQDTDQTFSGIDIPVLKTAYEFYSPFTIDVTHPNEVVFVKSDWCMRCLLVKYDILDGDTDYGDLGDLVFKVVLDPIE